MGFPDQPSNARPMQIVDPFSFTMPPLPALSSMPASVEVKSDTPGAPQANNQTGMFMSAGLVSKVNHDPEEDKGPVVPDTPCKKSSTTTFATYPPGFPTSVAKPGRSPASAYSSGSQSSNDDAFGGYGRAGRGLGLFHNMGRGPRRRASVLDLKDQNESPIAKDKDGRSTPEGWPPTPTKLFLTPAGGGGGGNDALESPSANRHTPISAMRPFGPRAPSCT